MIPPISHPAAELLVRKMHEAAAQLGTAAAQLDGLARALLAERDSTTGTNGFRVAFPNEEDADVAITIVNSFRDLYANVAGHDVPPLAGLPTLRLPEDAADTGLREAHHIPATENSHPINTTPNTDPAEAEAAGAPAPEPSPDAAPAAEPGQAPQPGEGEAAGESTAAEPEPEAKKGKKK